MKKKIYIIGAGPGTADFLTQRALSLIKGCDAIFSTAQRLTHSITGVRENIIECPLAEIENRLHAEKGQNIGLLVSGDTGFFSVARSLLQKLENCYDTEVICGLSSMQYFCSKIGIGYENLKVVSLHGREKDIIGAVAYNPRVFVLTGGINKAHTVCRSLIESGLSQIKVTVGENLSMPCERIVGGTAEELSKEAFDDLAVMLLENQNYVNCYQQLSDKDFIREKVPMTKEEVRAVTLSKLGVEPGDIVYDIGAGTGSVAIEMARKAFDGCVYAIEKDEEAVNLINKNRIKLGAYNVNIISGNAPDALEGLPVPDKVFIGGSSGNMGEIVEKLMALNPHVHMAANAITIESLNDAVNAFEKNGLEPDIVCINAAVSKKVGRYHMMNANNPVYVITGKEAHIVVNGQEG